MSITMAEGQQRIQTLRATAERQLPLESQGLYKMEYQWKPLSMIMKFAWVYYIHGRRMGMVLECCCYCYSSVSIAARHIHSPPSTLPFVTLFFLKPFRWYQDIQWQHAREIGDLSKKLVLLSGSCLPGYTPYQFYSCEARVSLQWVFKLPCVSFPPSVNSGTSGGGGGGGCELKLKLSDVWTL